MFALTKSITYRNANRFIPIKRLYAAIQSQPAIISDEYTDKPIYPEILELSREAHFIRKKQSWYDQIQSLETIEEKIIKINMPRYYGFRVIAWDSDKYPYNCLPVTQHYTRTLFENYDNLPNVKKNEAENAQIDSFVKSVSNNIKEAVEYSQEFFRIKYDSGKNISSEEKDKILGQIIVENVNRTLINTLSADASYLSDVEIDLNPRHEAFWAVGGVKPSKDVVKSRKGREWSKHTADMPVDRLIQYKGEPYLTIRHKHPLPPIKAIEDCTSAEKSKEVPLFTLDPRTIGYKTKYCHGTNIPGFWPGSHSGFGVISFQPRDHLITRDPKYGQQDFQEALHAQGIQSSFAWLLSLANYNGFNTYNDITYPMTTQTIITNGKKWSFYRYQLNTTLIHSDHVHENPKANYCWGTNEIDLFQEIDENGKCVGFNENVVKNLIELYINEPVETQIELQPYLSKEVQKVANIEDNDKREFLEKVFKHISSNRPRHLELPEIYLWERIYKINNKTRPMEAKRRYFELGINPWRRTLDQHDLVYIPRAVRPDGPKSKPKFKKTYYP